MKQTKYFIGLIIFLLLSFSLSFADDSLQVILTISEIIPLVYTNISLVCKGDLNNDGYNDIILPECEYDNNRGRVRIFFGGSVLDTIPDIIIIGENLHDRFGKSVSIGDMNGDGYDELIVGALFYGIYPPDYGRVYIYLGSENFDNIPDIILDGINYAPDPWGVAFGCCVDNTGDFNNDTYKDLVITAPGPDMFYYGNVYIFFGGETIDTQPDFFYQGEGLSCTGSYLSVGDINGDNYSDIGIGTGWGSNLLLMFLGGENIIPV